MLNLSVSHHSNVPAQNTGNALSYAYRRGLGANNYFTQICYCVYTLNSVLQFAQHADQYALQCMAFQYDFCLVAQPTFDRLPYLSELLFDSQVFN